MSTGRNEPCPCGSGRKYKKCCLNTAPDPINYMKQKLDRFHNRVVGELLRHAAKTFDPEAIDEAAAEFLCWPDEEDAAEMDLADHETLFYPWFLFKWRIDPDDGECILAGPRGLSVVQSYLQTHGRKLDPVERESLEACANAPLSFFEVVELTPGHSVTLRDLLLDRDLRVHDKSASATLHQGGVVFGSVVETGGIALFDALSAIAFKPTARLGILSLRDRMSMGCGGQITAETLEEYDLEIRALYHDLFIAHTTMPALCNTDGEKLSLHSLRYTISTPQKVFDALKGLTNDFVTEEEMLEQAEFDHAGHLCKVKIPWLKAGNPKNGGMENTVHGHLFINDAAMTCEVNSAERAARLRTIIAKSLTAGDAVYQTTVIQSAAAMMRDAPPSAAISGPDADLMALPEVREQIDQMMRKHWEKWPDMELPALHGQTPRQAVREELGRKLVNVLLEDAEQRCRTANGTLGSLDNLLKVRGALGL